MPATNGCEPAAPCGGHNSQAGAVAGLAGAATVEVAAVVPLPAEDRPVRPAAFTDEPVVPDTPVAEVAAGPTRLTVGVLTVTGWVAPESPAVLVVVPVVAAVCAAAGVDRASKSGKAGYATSCQALPRKCLMVIARLYGSRACRASQGPRQKSSRHWHPRSG